MELLLQMEVPRKPPSQKRASVKPIKPEAVIVISPDTKEEAKEKNSLCRKAAAEDSSRKTYECNGDMHVGSLSFSRRMNSSANLAAETPAPSINRQGSWNQLSDQRKMQAKSSQPPIRKPALIGQMRSCGISQAACGLNIKLPKEKIEDFDAGYVKNEWAVVEYAENIYKFGYKEAEVTSSIIYTL
ncbi:PREDICTED: uncharacterized protein LOC109176388 [Ipomoea nil]|uniref:uncharacterized protein LOC109176388 n=1 Tax=Ipomoea nil TaxID=35883 RepID=UPI0009011B34|nr:PREDICTED: uncharacterized protein LOC109176388 [Ipomoea nil]